MCRRCPKTFYCMFSHSFHIRTDSSPHGNVGLLADTGATVERGGWALRASQLWRIVLGSEQGQEWKGKQLITGCCVAQVAGANRSTHDSTPRPGQLALQRVAAEPGRHLPTSISAQLGRPASIPAAIGITCAFLQDKRPNSYREERMNEGSWSL